MSKHVALTAVLIGIILLLAALAAGAIGCGPQDSTTTTAAPKTTADTDPSQTTTAAVTTTIAPGPAGLSGPFSETSSPPLEQYRNEMSTFGQALADLPITDDPSAFTDVTTVASEQLQAAKDYVAGIHSAIAQLRDIQPPEGIADAHQEVVAGIEALAAATDKLIVAIESVDQAAFDAALTEGQAAVQALQASMEALGSLLGGTTPST
jgi:hypothetical protein